jgi:hypothetical protein
MWIWWKIVIKFYFYKRWMEAKHYACPFYKVLLSRSTDSSYQVINLYHQKLCILHKLFFWNEIEACIYSCVLELFLYTEWKWAHFLHDTGIMQAINKVIQDMGRSPWLNLKTSGIMTSKEAIMASQGSCIHHLLPGRETHHSVGRRVATLQVQAALCHLL